jgi:beta-galactosidase
VHIDLNGIYVTTSEVSEEMAKVNLTINVINNRKDDADVNIVTRLVSADGKEAGQAAQSEIITSGSNEEITQTISVNNPQIWSPDSPALYKVEVSLYSDSKQLDVNNITMGIRSIEYDAQKGFLINGKSVKLRGGCVHHDNGILGAAAFSRAEERKVEIMKANGFNAIRTSHTRPLQDFLTRVTGLASW